MFLFYKECKMVWFCNVIFGLSLWEYFWSVLRFLSKCFFEGYCCILGNKIFMLRIWFIIEFYINGFYIVNVIECLVWGSY